MKIEIRKHLFPVLAFVGLLWLIYLIGLPLLPTSYSLMNYSLQPRVISGLVGIFTMPFLHDGLDHLLANTIPLTVLLFILGMTRPKPWRVVVFLSVLSGVFIWVLGLSKNVVGASGLIYSLTLYLITAGLMERKPASVVGSVLVGVLYGSLFWGLLPTAGTRVAWDAHLLAAIAGAVFAWQTLREKKSPLPETTSQLARVPDMTSAPVTVPPVTVPLATVSPVTSSSVPGAIASNEPPSSAT